MGYKDLPNILVGAVTQLFNQKIGGKILGKVL